MTPILPSSTYHFSEGGEGGNVAVQLILAAVFRVKVFACPVAQFRMPFMAVIGKSIQQFGISPRATASSSGMKRPKDVSNM